MTTINTIKTQKLLNINNNKNVIIIVFYPYNLGIKLGSKILSNSHTIERGFISAPFYIELYQNRVVNMKEHNLYKYISKFQ